MAEKLRLGVNIDHVATLRNARGGRHPDPLRAALQAAAAGADSVVAHLREDRRHISDDDIARLLGECALPLNLEMAATAEMLEIALRHRPPFACLVPERREERTTEGGLDVAGRTSEIARVSDALAAAGIRVALFIEPERVQLEAAVAIRAPMVELHTGRYSDASGSRLVAEGRRLAEAARIGASLGLEIHAGHGLTYDNVGAVAAIPEVVELNIGHYLVGEAILTGFENSIRRMRSLIDDART